MKFSDFGALAALLSLPFSAAALHVSRQANELAAGAEALAGSLRLCESVSLANQQMLDKIQSMNPPTVMVDGNIVPVSLNINARAQAIDLSPSIAIAQIYMPSDLYEEYSSAIDDLHRSLSESELKTAEDVLLRAQDWCRGLLWSDER